MVIQWKTIIMNHYQKICVFSIISEKFFDTFILNELKFSIIITYLHNIILLTIYDKVVLIENFSFFK